MKVLLIRPASPNKLSFAGILDNEPIELEYLHTVLSENGYEDYLFDGMVEIRPIEEVIKRESPDIVAITGYIAQENLMKKYAKIAKKINEKIVTIVGGVHAQLNYERFYCEDIDYIARSECMNAFVSLVEFIETGKEDISKINGVCFKKDGVYVINELTPIDINTLPIPDRSHFYKYQDKYRYLDLTPLATVKTAFSCPYNCNFCYCTKLGCGKYNARDLDLVIEEIEGIKCDNIQIVDDDFLVDRKRLFKFVEMIKERKIKKKFVCYTRADFAAKNPDIIEMLADIGFKYFLVGLEAINDNTLLSMNKKTTDEINRKCVENINKTKGHCIGMFIVGIDAKKEDFDNIVNWVEDTGLKYVTASMFTPIPGTQLYEENKHLITSKRIEDWDFLHLVMDPTNMTRSQYYREYYKMFLKFYKIAKKTGVYDFMDIAFYKKIITNYFKRKIYG
jgi:radical SAM superfamily enzyme YgiQ (UPF0313 family)